MAKEKDPAKQPPTHSEAKGLILLSSALVLILCLMSLNVSHSSKNWLGMFGHAIGLGFTYLFGFSSYAIALFSGWMGWSLLCGKFRGDLKIKLIYFSLFICSLSILLNLIAEHIPSLGSLCENKIYSESILLMTPYPHRFVRFNLGGVPLYFLYADLPTMSLQRLFSDFGIGVIFSLSTLVSFALLTEVKLFPIIRKGVQLALKFPSWVRGKIAESRSAKIAEEFDAMKPSLSSIEETLNKKIALPLYSPKADKITIKTAPEPDKILKLSAPSIAKKENSSYQIPPPSLLNNPKKVDLSTIKKDLRKMAETLEESLMSFGIEAKVGEINCGPTITSFEVHPAVGVKVQKIKALENDIALNLQAKSIRIIAPIPGKAVVGVEIPSPQPQEVSFKELLVGYLQGPKKMHIPVLLGKTVNGETVINDLTRMPHCIIAGATGSGKSVCINTMIMSILMTATPDEIKLIMIDPKKVELTPYTNLPHLIAPVITEAHGAYAALSWLVKEMQLRYEILKQLGLRNITAFNSRKADKDFEASLSMPIPEKMYGIVAIIDEFADLMMVSSSDLETPIARIAQMARAVGIHLVLATQRPSREVITGLIKANFPTRIAFKVASRINSSIILDEAGAESLLGNGDMLFLPPGSSHLMRAQGAYISDEEINRVIQFINDQAPPNYLIASFDQMRKEEFGTEDEESAPKDSLYDQALSIVLDTKNASTTFLQRKLKIGYARAASLIDELESKGVIGPQEGSKPRRILHPGASSAPDRRGYSHDKEEEMDF